MSQQWQLGVEGTSSDDRRRSRSPPSLRRLVLDVMDSQTLQNLLTPVMEPIVRRVVKEEVDSAFRQHMINMQRFKISGNFRNDILPSEPRNLQLQFLNAISLPVFTGTCIKGEDSTDIEVALVDAPNGQVVSSGLGSSAKVEIVVLKGDFGGEGGENWRREEFTRNIVRERKGKKPLLIGAVKLTLKDGKQLVRDVSFTDNSSWTRSRKFRLGARLMDNINGISIREAISEPFIIKSRPRESQKKHRPPSPSDEVWRLDNISKDGQFHKRLSEGGVNTVQDFLTLFFSEPKRLRQASGSNSFSKILQILRKMSAKAWELTVEHARTCVLDSTLYVYDGSTSPQTNGVVYNVVGQVMGMFKDGQYVYADKLSDPEKAHARELVISALENRDKVVILGNEPSLNVPPLLPSSNIDHNHQDLSSHNIGSFPYTPQHDASSSDFMKLLWPLGGPRSFDGLSNNLEPMDIWYDQFLSFPNQVSDILKNGMSSEMNSTAIPCPSVVPTNKVRGRWDVLVSLLRWRFAIKRIMTRKTRVWATR